MSIAIGLLLGIILTSILAWWLFLKREKEYKKLYQELQQSNLLNINKIQKDLDLERQARIEAQVSLNHIEELKLSLRDKELENSELQDRLREAVSKQSYLESRLESQENYYKSLNEEIKKSQEKQHQEFQNIASKIMEQNSLRFQEVSKEGVSQILQPLQQQVEHFRKRIDEVHTQESKEMATLFNEIQNLKNLNQQISQDAINLTKALKGEHKQQGIWGEMVLERILEASGLREGEEFEREKSLNDSDGRRFRPDVILHLPADRDLIIDAKTSLNAYERYIGADSEAERRVHSQAHLEAIKKHIKDLSEKNYANLEGIKTLDFIFMFLPIEGALNLAMQLEPKLYEWALERNIILVNPTTLLVALRAVEGSWKQEHRSRNAQEIASQAGALYDKFATFATDLEKMGRQIDTLRSTYETTWSRLGTGRGNILNRMEKIRQLGARTSKKLPKKLSDMLEDEV